LQKATLGEPVSTLTIGLLNAILIKSWTSTTDCRNIFTSTWNMYSCILIWICCQIVSSSDILWNWTHILVLDLFVLESSGYSLAVGPWYTG